MSAETNNHVVLDQQTPAVGDSNDQQQQPPSESLANLDAPTTNVAASAADAADQNAPNPEQDSSLVEQDPLKESAQKTIQSIQSNQDYQAVVKVLNVLKHQLIRANKDIETLTRMKKDAMDNPFSFVLDLKSKKKMKRPPPRLQRILSVPEVDWTKYRFVPESRFARQTASLAHLTHLYTSNVSKRPGMFKSILDHPSTLEQGTMAVGQSKDVMTLQEDLAKGLASVDALTAPSSAVGSETSDPGGGGASDEDDGEQRSIPKSQRRVSSQTGGTTADKYIPSRSSPGVNPMKQRGTPHDVPTHNLPWSDEEQQRLEQLLEIYPDEPIQAQRFTKIANAMGTRTARQVGSRIQKYFIKLAKMGLPIPGRLNNMPKPIKPKAASSPAPPSPASSTTDKRKRPKMRKADPSRQKIIGYNSMVSGGMTNSKVSGAYYTMVPSVYMPDDEEIDDSIKKAMRRVANPTNEDTSTVQETVIHEGFACDSCGAEPIVGVLYKCTVCDEAEEVDLCSKCMALGTFTNDQHSLDHTFEAVRTAAPPYYADNDYASPEHLGEYSYLGY